MSVSVERACPEGSVEDSEERRCQGSSNPVSDSPGFKSNTGFYVEKDTLLVECMWRGGKEHPKKLRNKKSVRRKGN